MEKSLHRAITGLVLLLVLAVPGPLRAETVGPPEAAGDPDWSFALKTKVFMNSFTAYEFGSPDPPKYSPLSRLKFDMDSIWGGFAARRKLDRFSLGLEYMGSSVDQDAGRMRDSDWDGPPNPTHLSLFSESKNQLRPSFQLTADADVQVADLLGLGPQWDLRPLLGFRWQELSFLVHDGTQWDYDTPDVWPLPGELLTFHQTWRQYFLGLGLGYDWGPVLGLHRLKVTGQADWAYVQGDNRDDHLLQPDRITREETTGDALHATLGLVLGLTERLDLGLEAEYLSLDTTGTHSLHNGPLHLNMKWTEGVRVWSEQTSLQLTLSYAF